MTGILSFSFISLVTLGSHCVVVAVDALGAAAEEVVVVQQLLLPSQKRIRSRKKLALEKKNWVSNLS